MSHPEDGPLFDRLWAGAAPAPPVAPVVAHPDDEVIGAGAQLPAWQVAGVIHVTDGAPRDLRDARAAGFAAREAYAAARRAELCEALALAGIGPERAHAVGLVDQEATLDLAGLARRLADLLAAIRPEVVVTHPYEGGHPDHDATAFAVHAAVRLLRLRGVAPPEIVEMTSYHSRSGRLNAGEFFPGSGERVVTRELSEAQRAFKERLFACFRTQRAVLRGFPIGVERFRPAPRYDFTRPPHAGTLFYEQFPWGMTGDRWRRLAAEALARLFGPDEEARRCG